jgi:hypothetical protein
MHVPPPKTWWLRMTVSDLERVAARFKPGRVRSRSR